MFGTVIYIVIRFVKHLFQPFLGNRNRYNKQKYPMLYAINFILWLVLIPLKALEVFGFSHLLGGLFKLLTSTRRLSTIEVTELQLVFGKSLPYSKIRINENSFWLKITRQKGMGFVWMNTINFSRDLDCRTQINDMGWLVHEAVHVSQFNKLGIQYIFEALTAQLIGGYEYGGRQNIKNKRLDYFNLEQQADIARAFYFDLKKNRSVDDYNIVISNLKKRQF